MKIPLHYSLKVARQVVGKIDLPRNIAKHCTVDSWSNCREQGLCIKVNIGNKIEDWKSICIAQQRNSDDILIIVGNGRHFDIQTNQPNDEIWKGRTHFRYDEITKAVKFIENSIMEMATKKEEIT